MHVLLQCTRWDDLGYVKEFIKTISNLSNLVAHQLIWNMQTNMYKVRHILLRSSLKNDQKNQA